MNNDGCTVEHSHRDGRIFIILSGAYCAGDIVAEFGRLPPAFLPIGASPLFVRQAQFAKRLARQVILTVPSDFEISAADSEKLHELDVQTVRSPASIPLTMATQFILDVLDARGELILLHGDTLVELDESSLADTVAVDETSDYYAWAEVADSESANGLRLQTTFGDGASSRRVACGLFGFADAYAFRQALHEAGDFISAIDAYGTRQPLRSIPVKKWYDFGNLRRMLRSRRDLLISRAFNSITCEGVSIIKTSSQQHKIASEIAWYESIPTDLRAFTPQFLGALTSESSDWPLAYRLEYVYQPTLAELFIFGRLPRYVWHHILVRCLEFIDICRKIRPDANTVGAPSTSDVFQMLIIGKSRRRTEEFLSSRRLSLDTKVTLNGVLTPRIRDALEELISIVPPTSEETLSLMHGDFFFGNMFFDFRADRVRVVDPRGEIEAGAPTIWGDWRYDLAKLAHSVHGQYDHILAGRARVVRSGATEFAFDRNEQRLSRVVAEDFATLSVAGLPCLDREIRAIEAMLFLSMLPLHADDPVRQDMLFANGLLIHRELTV